LGERRWEKDLVCAVGQVNPSKKKKKERKKKETPEQKHKNTFI
jgi:hypothetical protein